MKLREIIFYFPVFLICGCSSLKLTEIPRSNIEDWKVYGGNIGRTNCSKNSIKVPMKPVWEYEVGGGFNAFGGSVVGNILCVGDLRGEVNLINIEKGKSISSRNFGSAIAGTPIIDSNCIYIAFAHDSKSMRSYNLISGSLEWAKQIGDIESTPLLINQHLYITTADGKLICLNKLNGATIWEFEPQGNRLHKATYPSPASDGAIVVFGNDGGDLYALDAFDGGLKWESKTSGSIVASPSISSGKVFVGSLDSTFYAFNATTGQTLWTSRLNSKIYASQAVDNKNIYLGTNDRKVFCLNISDGSVKWETGIGSVVTSAPFVAGEIVFCGCLDKNLYAIESNTGKILWQYKTGSRIKTSPLVWKNYLFIFSENRSVIALQPESE